MSKNKLWKRKITTVIMAGLLLLPAGADAAIQTINGTGEYIMEDNETMKQAQDKAYEEAMRSIAQQAAVYIRSGSKAESSVLTKDEVELIATALV